MSKANELFIGKQTQRVCVDRLRLSQISGCTTWKEKGQCSWKYHPESIHCHWVMQPICVFLKCFMYSSNFDKLHVQPLEMWNHPPARIASTLLCARHEKSRLLMKFLLGNGRTAYMRCRLFIAFIYTHILYYNIHRFEKMSWMQTTPATFSLGIAGAWFEEIAIKAVTCWKFQGWMNDQETLQHWCFDTAYGIRSPPKKILQSSS